MDTYQAQDLAVEAVGIAAYNQKPELIALLAKNGVKVPDDISERDLISITLVACAKSNACRADLSNFLTESIAEGQLGYVQDEFFNSVGGPRIVIPGVTPGTTAPKTETQTDKKKKKGGKVFAKKEGGSAVGNFFRSEQGKDTIKTGINLGFSTLLKGKSGAEANQTLQSATEQGDNAGKGDTKSKWVLPAIIGGVVLIGVIVYFSTRGAKGKA